MKHRLSRAAAPAARLAVNAVVATIAVIAVIATYGAPVLAHTVNDDLPGGTGISVGITTPVSGAVLPAGPVTVTGTASVGQGTQDDIALITVLDVSGSTADGGACGGDPNGDGVANTTLDCEIAAAIELNTQAGSSGTVSEVGAAVFGTSGASADVGPGPGQQLITGPTTDNGGQAGPDMAEMFASATTGHIEKFSPHDVEGTTSFAAGINAAAVSAAASTKARKVVAFMSDGRPNGGDPVQAALDALPSDVNIYTFAIGAGAECGNPNVTTSLQYIADETGGICEPVEIASDLPDILPGVIASQLTSLTLSVDAGLPTPITNVVPPLPQNGPANVTYTTTTGALSPGPHTLCVTASGSDRGGPGNVTECHAIVINAPPVPKPGGPYSGQEGTPVGIAGSVVDPDSNPANVVTTWAISPGGDPGTSCVIANPSALSTTVTCTDDGVFTLTLTANDGINPPVAANTTLTLTNVAPAVSISAPPNGTLVAKGVSLAFTAPFTDIGTNDTHTCTVNFDDGTPIAAGTVAEVPGSGTCTISHAFTALGPHNVLVKVVDDDGGSATAVVRVVVYLPGEAFALQASGLVTIPKTPHVTCPPNASKTQLSVNLAIAVVNALNASCTVDPATGTTVAKASVDRAVLLGGLITITNISSTCEAGAGGISRTSSVGTINGITIGTGSGSLVIPLVATVHFNESATVNGKLVRNAIRVRTLLGQEIILSSCRLG